MGREQEFFQATTSKKRKSKERKVKHQRTRKRELENHAGTLRLGGLSPRLVLALRTLGQRKVQVTPTFRVVLVDFVNPAAI